MVQGNCTLNLDQIFAQLLFRRDHFHSCSLISLFKISYYNSNNAPHPPPPRGPLNKINNRYDIIFFLLRVDPKCPGKPYTKFGPDILCYTHLVPSSSRGHIQPVKNIPFHSLLLWSKATALLFFFRRDH